MSAGLSGGRAPAALSVRDTLYLFQSTFERRPIYETTTPDNGQLSLFNPLLPFMPGAAGPWDPAIFHDDETDRWFMYFGSSNVYPIYGIELDYANQLTYLGTAKELIALHPELHGWERFGRDHRDSGSVASPYRETEAMKDGSDAIADWPILNALVNTAAGAHWVSVHHGGGVGIGYSIHAGMVVVADGSENAAARLERVLTTDPGMGVVRQFHTPQAAIMPITPAAKRRTAFSRSMLNRGFRSPAGKLCQSKLPTAAVCMVFIAICHEKKPSSVGLTNMRTPTDPITRSPPTTAVMRFMPT
jgi:hypothetical protein